MKRVEKNEKELGWSTCIYLDRVHVLYDVDTGHKALMPGVTGTFKTGHT
eukprot:COSAG02_NODE_236_length_27740_cov_49.156073_10_plen_49_part_00